MQREQKPMERTAPAGGGGPGPQAESVEQIHVRALGMLDVVDRTLDALRPHHPEDYERKTHQRLQTGGQ